MIDRAAFLAYLLANVGFVAISGLLAGLSVLAYARNSSQVSYLIAGLGFTCIGLAGLFESAYTFVVEQDYLLSSSEFLVLQAAEDVIIAVGLALLFLAIAKHRQGASRAATDSARVGEERYWTSEKPFDD